MRPHTIKDQIVDMLFYLAVGGVFGAVVMYAFFG